MRGGGGGGGSPEFNSEREAGQRSGGQGTWQPCGQIGRQGQSGRGEWGQVKEIERGAGCANCWPLFSAARMDCKKLTH
jgi:hypothetical protein